MTHTLYIGEYAYSSWSLRAWLLFEKFGIARSVKRVPFDQESVADQLAHLAPARTVPTVVFDDGAVVSDSLAIAEELNTRYLQAGIWPTDLAARAVARNLAAEMHCSYAALRSECPMNTRLAYRDISVSDAVYADVARIEEIWRHAREVHADAGPWLCGTYSAADAFFAPVAARFVGFGFALSDVSQAYVDAHLNDDAFRRWRAMGQVLGADLPWYAQSFPTVDWPGPKLLNARAVDGTASENTRCPYSGKAVTHCLELDGRTFGFCNAFCRDKTVADPAAWPAFMKIYQS